MGNQVAKKAGNTKNQQSEMKNSTTSLPINTTSSSANIKSSDMSRSSSSVELQSHSNIQFLPVDRLAKMLTDLAQKEESIHGVTQSVFKKYLFPHYAELADRLFKHLHASSKSTTAHISQSSFKQQVEQFLGIMNDQIIIENYVKMFAANKDETDIEPEGLTDLVLASYRLTMSKIGSSTCAHLFRTINSVVTSCFHGKEILSVSYVSNWLSQNCPRIVQGLHRYVIHILTTAYRSGKSLMASDGSGHVEPSTPVLDQPNTPDFSQPPLPKSLVWLLSTILPECYIQIEESQSDGMQGLIQKMSGNSCPRHWTLLYHSDQHGAGANRFLHHVLGYKGPTLTIIKGGGPDEEESTPTYCVCSAIEWRETHLYWGNEDSMIIELFPCFRVIERGPKLLYLNTNIRGYPQGLRAGSDPRNPSVIIDQSFNSINFAGRVPYRIAYIEVWGCGDIKSREKQIEIKKWQKKEAEKQRIVKLSTSEWLDHPDRYLLELAGRPQYNNSSS